MRLPRPRAKSPTETTTPPTARRRSLVWRVVAALPSLLILALLGWVALFALYAPKLPDTDALMAQGGEPSISVLAADGTVLADGTGDGSRFVPLTAISPRLIEAVVATEDHRFWVHFGVDPVGIARAAVANLRAGGVVEGGSTITQQLAKMLFLTPARNLRRKLEEMMLALWLEARLSKQEILTLYLNKAYLGAGSYGVEAAARRYFAKPAKELNLAESAMLAGLLKAPSALAPTNDLDAARDRAVIVLQRMTDEGAISETEAIAARTRPAKLAAEGSGDLAGYFVDWVIEGVTEALGRPRQDLVVRTTLDPSLQRHAREALVSVLNGPGAAVKVGTGAVVLLDTSGAVRAMVGGENYRASHFNHATAAKRQPGSAFKPFVFAVALEQGYRPDTRVLDAPVRVGDWSPTNYDNTFEGEVSLRTAFASSLNTPAVRIVEDVGVGKVVDMARRLGIASVIRSVPSLALGTSEVTPLELTGAYLPFAAGGVQRPVFGVVEVSTRSGRVLHRHQAQGEEVLSPAVASAMGELFRAAVLDGTGRAARIAGRMVGGKTGTTQNSRDAWFVGFSGDYVLGVWLGNDDGTPMRNVTGGGLPARVWREVMAATPVPKEPEAVIARLPVPAPRDRLGSDADDRQRLPETTGRNVPEELARRGMGWLIDLVEDALATARN